jgi:hypothetical protein
MVVLNMMKKIIVIIGLIMLINVQMAISAAQYTINGDDDDPETPPDDPPDYVWEVRMILWGKNLYINNESYNGGKLVITSERDLENPQWIEIYFDDESCRALLTVWITRFIRITIPYNHYGVAVLQNFNGIITPGFRENSYIIRGTTYGTSYFYEP